MNVVGQSETSSVNGMRFRSSGDNELNCKASSQVLITCSRSSGDVIQSISGQSFRTASRVEGAGTHVSCSDIASPNNYCYHLGEPARYDARHNAFFCLNSRLPRQ